MNFVFVVLISGQSGRENRVSFVPSKRPSWNRSLSIRFAIQFLAFFCVFIFVIS